MKNSDQVVSELTNELAIALLLDRRAEDSEKRAKIVIETLRGEADRKSELPEPSQERPAAA